MSLKLRVEGMHCKSCKMLIEEELEDIGATNISVTFDAQTQVGSVRCTGISYEEAVKAIEELGDYEVTIQ